MNTDPRDDAASSALEPDPPGRTTDHHAGARIARWRAGWRVALRLARRDVRRHRGRGVLVVIMAGVPVALLVGVLTFVTSGAPDAAALASRSLGSAQAAFPSPLDQQVTPLSPDLRAQEWGGEPAEPIPGFRSDDPVPQREAALGEFLGGEVVSVGSVEVRIPGPEGGRTPVTALVTDPARGLGTKAELRSGRWPAATDEITVTAAGAHLGLPTSGEVDLTLVEDGAEVSRTVTVVGESTGYDAAGRDAAFVIPSLPDLAADQLTWLLMREQPVSWPEVERLTEYGLLLTSAAVLADPPDLGADVEPGTSLTETGLVGTLLLVVVVLLVGPAFAVSATRQRHLLALAAVNGAEGRQLRRTMLAQAVVLGATAVAIGSALGVLGAWGSLSLDAVLRPGATVSVFAVPVVPVLLVAGCGVLACVVAALFPSRRLGRLDLIREARGRFATPPPRRAVAVTGAVGCLVFGGVLWFSTRVVSDVAAAVGVIGLFSCVLLLVPALLGWAGRVGRRLPLVLRVAARDVARNRARATPTVAALLAATSLLAAVSVVLSSETATADADYLPRTASGEGELTMVEPGDELAGLVSRTPRLMGTQDHEAWIDPRRTSPEPVDEQQEAGAVLLVPPGCDVGEVQVISGGGALVPQDGQLSCPGLRASFGGPSIAVWPAEEIVRRLRLEGAAAAAVLDGAGVATDRDVSDGVDTLTLTHTRWIEGAESWGPNADSVIARTDLPVVVAPDQAAVDAMGVTEQTGEPRRLVVPLEVAGELDWPLRESAVHVHAEDRPITTQEQEDLQALAPIDASVYVERGFVDTSGALTLVLYLGAALLAVCVTLMSTALALAEQQEDQGTLAAVGATRRTRRGLAGAQAAVTGLLGSVLGIALGVVLGLALVAGLTDFDALTQTRNHRDMIYVIPALPLLAIAVGVPVVAAAAAWVSVRRHPRVTRRLA